MSRLENCFDNAPLEGFFRSFKTECMPKIEYGNFIKAEYSVSYYIDKYYNNVMPRHYNVDLAPNESEVRTKILRSVAKSY